MVTIHDLAFETWPQDFAPATRAKYRVITPRAARSAERVICPSAFTADDVCRRYGVDPAKVRVIPDAPALPINDRPPAVEARDPYVLAVGDLRPKKNLAPGRRLRRDPTPSRVPHRLVLAGIDAGEGPRLRALAAGEPVQLTGYVDDARLDALMRGAELLVHPSLYEGFGLVVLEAMARGTPVLAAGATALPETGGDAADYFDPGEPGDLERRLQLLLGDAQRRAQLARRRGARGTVQLVGDGAGDRRRLPRAAVNTTILLLSVDEAPMLERSLPAALAQEPAAEVVVVDNACTDATAAVAERHGVRRLAIEPRRSYAAAINAGHRPDRRRRGAAAQRRLLPGTGVPGRGAAPARRARRRLGGAEAPAGDRDRDRRPRSTPPACSSTAGARTGSSATAGPPSASPAPPRRSAPTALPRCTAGRR